MSARAPQPDPWPSIDYQRMAEDYDRGRALLLEYIGAWRDALAPYLASSPGAVLDLGAGTGLFTHALSEWFGITVIGVEPSDAMRAQAAAKGLPTIGGRAEQIPLKPASCCAAWLSKVLHHVDDLAACAVELRRVLRRERHVIIRNSFADRLDHVLWLRYFPEARAVAAARWPRVDDVARVFASAGFELLRAEPIPEVAAPDMQSYRERIGTRANSTLTLIDDDDFAAGLERMEGEGKTRPPGPVTEQHDMVVFKRKES